MTILPEDFEGPQNVQWKPAKESSPKASKKQDISRGPAKKETPFEVAGPERAFQEDAWKASIDPKIAEKGWAQLLSANPLHENRSVDPLEALLIPCAGEKPTQQDVSPAPEEQSISSPGPSLEHIPASPRPENRAATEPETAYVLDAPPEDSQEYLAAQAVLDELRSLITALKPGVRLKRIGNAFATAKTDRSFLSPDSKVGKEADDGKTIRLLFEKIAQVMRHNDAHQLRHLQNIIVALKKTSWFSLAMRNNPEFMSTIEETLWRVTAQNAEAQPDGAALVAKAQTRAIRYALEGLSQKSQLDASDARRILALAKELTSIKPTQTETLKRAQYFLSQALQPTKEEQYLYNQFSKDVLALKTSPDPIVAKEKFDRKYAGRRSQLDSIALKLALAGNFLPDDELKVAALQKAAIFVGSSASFGSLTESVRENRDLLSLLITAFPESVPPNPGVTREEKNALLNWLIGNHPHFDTPEQLAAYFFSICITATKLEKLLGVDRVFVPLVDASPVTDDLQQVLQQDPTIATISEELHQTTEAMNREIDPATLKTLIQTYQRLKKQLEIAIIRKFPVLKNAENFGKAMSAKILLHSLGDPSVLDNAKRRLSTSPWAQPVLHAGKDFLTALSQTELAKRPQGKERQKGLREIFTKALRDSGHLAEDADISDDDFDLCLEFLKKNVFDDPILSPLLSSIQKSERKSEEEFRSKLCGLYVWTTKQIEYLTKAVATLEKEDSASPALPHLRMALQKFTDHREAIREKLSPESKRLISAVETANPEDVQNVQTIFTHDQQLGGSSPESPAATLFASTCNVAIEGADLILQQALPLLPLHMRAHFSTPFSRALTSATLIITDAAKLCPNALDTKLLTDKAESVVAKAIALNTQLAAQ